MVTTISGVLDYNLCSINLACKSRFDEVLNVALGETLGTFIFGVGSYDLNSFPVFEFTIHLVDIITSSIIGLQSIDNIEVFYSFFLPENMRTSSDEPIQKPEDVLAFINTKGPNTPYKNNVTIDLRLYSLSTPALPALQHAQCGDSVATVFSDDDVSLVDSSHNYTGAIIGVILGGIAVICLAAFFYYKAKANTNAYVDANVSTNNAQAETLGKKTDTDTQGLDALDLRSQNANAHVATSSTSSIELAVATNTASYVEENNAVATAAIPVVEKDPVEEAASVPSPEDERCVRIFAFIVVTSIVVIAVASVVAMASMVFA